MEHGLGGKDSDGNNAVIIVLILVLMEHGLGDFMDDMCKRTKCKS